MLFLEYPKNVHTLIASYLRKRHRARVSPPQYKVLHWLTALQLQNPEIGGWLDPELSKNDEIALLQLMKEGEDAIILQRKP